MILLRRYLFVFLIFISIILEPYLLSNFGYDLLLILIPFWTMYFLVIIYMSFTNNNWAKSFWLYKLINNTK